MKKNQTILVVDDQPDNVFILQDRLQREGFRILTAYDGLTSISIAENEKPYLILLDVMMPGLSGFDVCERLIKNRLTSSIPIILVTALTDVEDIKHGLQSGAFDYIKKPYNRAELIARINSALRFSETQRMLIEIEKVNTYAATVLTANHEIKQPLTLINLSLTAINRELGKDEMRKDVLKKRVEFIEGATKEIIKILGKLSEIKKPILTEYVNDLKMVDLNSSNNGDDSSNQF